MSCKAGFNCREKLWVWGNRKLPIFMWQSVLSFFKMFFYTFYLLFKPKFNRKWPQEWQRCTLHTLIRLSQPPNPGEGTGSQGLFIQEGRRTQVRTIQGRTFNKIMVVPKIRETWTERKTECRKPKGKPDCHCKTEHPKTAGHGSQRCVASLQCTFHFNKKVTMEHGLLLSAHWYEWLHAL